MGAKENSSIHSRNWVDNKTNLHWDHITRRVFKNQTNYTPFSVVPKTTAQCCVGINHLRLTGTDVLTLTRSLNLHILSMDCWSFDDHSPDYPSSPTSAKYSVPRLSFSHYPVHGLKKLIQLAAGEHPEKIKGSSWAGGCFTRHPRRKRDSLIGYLAAHYGDLISGPNDKCPS